MEKCTIMPIIPCPIPYDLDAKVFYYTDEEGNAIGEPYSYNDHLKMLRDISGISHELMS